MSEILLPPTKPGEKDYAEYRQQLRIFEEASPQFQGLTQEEYGKATNDHRVKWAKTETGLGNDILLPQLVPIDTFGWLNEDFFARIFPGETDSDSIMHFTHFEDTVITPEVASRLKDIAENDGVLVIDFPEQIEDGYHEAIERTLLSAGVEVDDRLELGTQTYFTGELRLKRGYREDEPIQEFNRAFSRLQNEHEFRIDELARDINELEEYLDGLNEADTKEYRVEIDETIKLKKAELDVLRRTFYYDQTSEDEAQEVNEFFQEAFKKINDHPCRQGLTPEEFRHTLVHEVGVAKLAHVDKDSGEQCSVCILGNDLSMFPWLNTDYYKSRFPDEFENRQIIYFPSLATDPKRHGSARTKYIVNLITELAEYANNEIVVAFDCCDMNKGILDGFLEILINDTPQASIEFNVGGIQKYAALKLKPITKQD